MTELTVYTAACYLPLVVRQGLGLPISVSASLPPYQAPMRCEELAEFSSWNREDLRTWYRFQCSSSVSHLNAVTRLQLTG
ncbi:hypothetical protein R1sor_010451 [Riccia sorocarpa]|uniref:Uncharacterized protein n=1 Tax=Riccia sorocarpa TaxID=122646 RepID=A0ABD3HY24_9MARC